MEWNGSKGFWTRQKEEDKQRGCRVSTMTEGVSTRRHVTFLVVEPYSVAQIYRNDEHETHRYEFD